VPNYQNGGRNVAVPDENRPSWRPQDQDERHRARGNDDDHDYRGWRDRHFDRQERDPRRWEGSRGSELGYWEDRDLGRSERYGQGQSGYSAGRYADDRSQQVHNRNDPSFDDRRYDLGTDDRFSGRGWSAWSDRNERQYAGYDPERYSTQGSYGRQSDQRGYDQRGYEPRGYRDAYDRQAGYDRGFSQNGYGGQGYDPRTLGYERGNTQHMGYQSSAARGETDWSPSQKFADQGQHVHRGTGPHRGKGPLGYQRSDERIREMVCEALADDDMIDASQIQVTVKDGEVTLAGTVDNRRVKREAEDCVSSVSGVRDVQIQLRVRDEMRGSQMSNQTLPSNQGMGQTSTASHLGSGLANGIGKTENDVTSQDKKHRA
jgi:osmotically-inducible protein OsmY